MRKILSKPAALLCLALLFVACNKQVPSIFDQKLESETLFNPDSESFVSLSKATDIAAAFFSSLDPVTKSSVNFQKTVSSTAVVKDENANNAPMMHIINYTGGGFAIVSATRDYYPILAYSEENSFVFKENPEEMGAVVVWLEETKEAIRQSEDLDDKTQLQIRTLWLEYEPIVNTVVKTKVPDPEQDAAAYQRVTELANRPGQAYFCYRLSDGAAYFPDSQGAYDYYCNLAASVGSPLEYTIVGISTPSTTTFGPLLNTVWHQYNPFNTSCPISSFRTPAGCVAIAMG